MPPPTLVMPGGTSPEPPFGTVLPGGTYPEPPPLTKPNIQPRSTAPPAMDLRAILRTLMDPAQADALLGGALEQEFR